MSCCKQLKARLADKDENCKTMLSSAIDAAQIPPNTSTVIAGLKKSKNAMNLRGTVEKVLNDAS